MKKVLLLLLSIAVFPLISFAQKGDGHESFDMSPGEVSVHVDSHGGVHGLTWPKSRSITSQIDFVGNFVGYDAVVRGDDFEDKQDHELFFTQQYDATERSTSEVRTVYNFNVKNGSRIRTRQVVRTFGEDRFSNRTKEIEIVYEYKNETSSTIPDFYYGADFSIDLFEIFFFESFSNDTAVTYNYDPEKKMFWFGNDSIKKYIGIIMSVGSVHAAKIKQGNSFFSVGSYPNISFSEISTPFIEKDQTVGNQEAVLIFSSRRASFLSGERIYQQFVIGFSDSKEGLLGIVEKQRSSIGTKLDAGVPEVEGLASAPEDSSSGGCLLTKKIVKKKGN